VSTKLHVYETAEVTVTYDAARCIHNGHCVRNLPAVFNTSARPWVQPEHADAAQVLAIVAGCPTGALHAKQPGGETADGLIPDFPVAIRVSRNGPLFLRGAVTILDGETSDSLGEDGRVALCRCGLSKRKPFCDNTHRAEGWRDTHTMTDAQS
jgi:uncharacterized Fe-S cluster protein YjdI/CDGSH-type Zn-finger protein